MLSFIRQYAQYLAGGTSAVLFGVALSSETVFIDRWRDQYGSYRDGQIEPVSDRCIDVVDQILNRITLRADQEATLDVFSCYGQEPVVLGSLNSRCGAYIGFPPTYSFTSLSNVVNSDLMLMNRKKIDWDSPHGKELAGNVILTDSELSFAVARSLYYSLTFRPFVDAGLFAGGSLGWFISNNLVNQAVGYRLKGWARAIVYGITGSFWLLSTLVLRDTYTCYVDRSVDKRTCGLNPYYAKAGVDFYNKTLRRNIALRALSGSEGESLYTLKGNLKRGLREQSLPLTTRLAICEKQVKLWNEGKLEIPKQFDTTGQYPFYDPTKMPLIGKKTKSSLYERLVQKDAERNMSHDQKSNEKTEEGAENGASQ